MERQALIELCLSYPDVFEDYPFDNAERSSVSWTVMRHLTNKKTFALIYERDGLCINLKCAPARVSLLPTLFAGITPGYHMNKTHWITVKTDSDVELPMLTQLISESYRLTMPAKSRNTGKREKKA